MFREPYTFGSVRYRGDRASPEQIEYIPMVLAQIGKSRLWQVSEISDGLQEGKRFLLLGDYGAGKSMTLRELYYILKKRYQRATTSKFPADPTSEIIMVNKTSRGYLNVMLLPLAFNILLTWYELGGAGYAILLLDGFERLAVARRSGFMGRLQDAGDNAMQLVRSIPARHPSRRALAMGGRAYYFDGGGERSAALGRTGNCTNSA